MVLRRRLRIHWSLVSLEYSDRRFFRQGTPILLRDWDFGGVWWVFGIRFSAEEKKTKRTHAIKRIIENFKKSVFEDL